MKIVLKMVLLQWNKWIHKTWGRELDLRINDVQGLGHEHRKIDSICFVCFLFSRQVKNKNSMLGVIPRVLDDTHTTLHPGHSMY